MREATDAFQLYKSSVASVGYNTKSTTDKIKDMLGHVTKLGSIFSISTLAINSFTKSLGTLKDIDDILTEISKTSNMTVQELEKLGNISFKAASKYGKTASDYLTGIQEMSRSGFYGEKGSAMAEQSLLAQAAGDMTAEIANKYILATNAAYKYNGEAEKLNAVLDGQNSITNRNSVALSDMAVAMSEAGTVASSYRVSIEDLSAMIGTMESVTKLGGDEVGNGIKAILINLQNINSSKIVDTLDAANASMTEFVNGTEKLRDPISILRDLAETFNQLDEDDALRAEILTNIGGKHQASKLAALLQNMELFDKMLVDYSEGAGSALEEAMKSANNWTGKLNQIQNSWDSLVASITNKNTVLNGLTFGDKLIQGAESFIDTFGTIPTVLTAINTSMVAMRKDYGITKIWDKENQKFDVEGNIFGIDISKIKNLKKHYEEAGEAITIWNNKLRSGKADLETFNYEVVKNSTSLKEYLSTCYKDAPASLSGYKQYLQQTGQATEDLRLKTILLNTALTFLGSIAVQEVITGITQAFDKFNETVEESQEKVDDINSKISDLKTQIEELNNLEYKSGFDNQKIAQLEKELELQEKILEIEQKRLYQDQIGTKFSDYFDKDSLITKQNAEYDRNNKNGYSNLSRAFKTYESSLNDIDSELASLQEKLNSESLIGHDRFMTEGKITELTEKRNDLLEKQQTIEEQLTMNMGEYLENYRVAQEAVESGLLTGSDLEKAESMAEYWNQMYQDSSEIVANIQKMNSTYDNTNDLLEEKFGGISRDDLVSLSDDDKRIALSFDPDNIIGFEELQQKIEETKGDIEELNETEISITPTIASSIQQIATQLEPQFAKSGEAYQEIFTSDGFTLDAIDNSMLENLRKSFAEIESEVGVAFDSSKLEPFFDTLTNGNSTAEQVQQAFNELATAYLYSTDTLEQLNDETADAIEKQLEEMGVQNAAEVVAEALTAKTEELIVAKQYLAQTGKELASATEEERNAFILEQIEAGNCGEALALLQLKKILVNQSTITTAADCQNILDLAQAANIGIQQLQQLQTLMDMITQRDSAVQSGDSRAVSELNRAIKDFSNNITNNLKLDNVKVDFGQIGGGKSAAKSAGKDAGKSYKEGLEEELSNLNSVISGVTKAIDSQISSIKSQKEEAVAAIDAQIDALNEQKSALEDQKKALEEERDARIEIIEQQKKQLELAIKAIDKQIKAKEKIIDSINDEIKAMKDANAERQRQIDLQKAQYELERLQHQRTILIYSEEKGLHYTTNTKDIRSQKQKVDDARLEIEIANKQKQIDLIQKEIDLLNEKKDAINEQIDLLDEQIDQINEFYDAQIKAIDAQIDAIDKQIEALEKQREETEKYYELLIENLEKSKSKYEELTEIVEKAELSAALKKLGIDEEALLNGSEEEFEKLKNIYMGIVSQLNEGNDEFLSKLQELSGYDGTAPAVLSDSNDELDTMNGNLDTANQNVGTVNSSLGETASTTSDVAANVGDIETNLSEVNTLVSEEQTAFENLRQTIDDVIRAINEKITAIQEEQNAVGIATSSEMADFLLLKEKILEVKESLDSVNNTVNTMNRQPIDNLTTAFQLLYDQLVLVADILGAGMEGQGEGAVSGIKSAIEELNNISLEEGIIAQFTNLKAAVDEVTAAIGGGESSGGEGQGSGSGSAGGGESGGKGSEGEGSGDSLTGAITEMGETVNEVIGEPDAEGDGTVIGEFGSMETAVNDVTAAIGSAESEGGQGEEDGNLISSIIDLGDKTEEELGESGGDGIIGRFEEFESIIEEAANQVRSISAGLDEIDGKEVECTITINVKMNGSIPAFASGTVLGNMQIESASYNAKYGKAFASGTIGLPHAEKNALRSEYGQPELTVYPNGIAELTTSPVMSDLPKGTVIYNEEETKKIMDNKANNVGNAHADGTNDGSWIGADGHRYRDIQPGEHGWDLMQAGQALIDKWKKSGEEFLSNAYFEHQKQFEKWTKEITNNTAINNVVNKNVQQPVTVHQSVTINCPNVTNNSGVEYLEREFNGLHLKAMQAPIDKTGN